MARFIVTGGGTSGHINPAITIADALTQYYKEKGEPCEIIFTGRANGLEGDLVPKAGYKFHSIEAMPFPMKPSIRLIKAILALRRGRKACAKLINEFNPDAVIGTGGYVCAPLLLEAKKRKVKVMLHESNAFPGRANKLLGKKADLVMVGFESVKDVFSSARRIVVTGNPIRSTMLNVDYVTSRKNLGLADGEKLIFAMGGSLGSKTINDFILQIARDERFSDVKFVLAMGKQQSSSVDVSNVPANVEIKEYIYNPQDYLCAADICITRAGAVTCAEIAAVGSCSILVPYPYAAHDHQTFNARAFVDVDGAKLVADSDVAKGALTNVLLELINDDKKRSEMRQNARKLAVYDTNDRIINAIVDTLEGNAGDSK